MCRTAVSALQAVNVKRFKEAETRGYRLSAKKTNVGRPKVKHKGLLTQIERRGRDQGTRGSLVGHQADLTLPLFLLETHLDPPVSVGTTAAEHDDEGPYQPEP